MLLGSLVGVCSHIDARQTHERAPEHQLHSRNVVHPGLMQRLLKAGLRP